MRSCSDRTGEGFQAEDRRWDHSCVCDVYGGGADYRKIGDQLGSGHGYGQTGRDNHRFTGGGGADGAGGGRCR